MEPDDNKSGHDVADLEDKAAGSVEGGDSEPGVERIGIRGQGEAEGKVKVKDKSNKALTFA